MLAAGVGWWMWQEDLGPADAVRRLTDTVEEHDGPPPLVVRTSTPPVPEIASRSGLTVLGLVHNGAGNPEPGAEVRGCDRLTTTDDEGRFTLVVAAGDCLLHAQRVDGAMPTEGPRVPVSGAAGTSTTVLLSLPEYPQGFAGVFLGIGEGANRVASVAPGSQAQAEGVRAGHTVLEIDGAPVERLDAEALWARIQGDAGTSVTLRLRTPGGEVYTVTLPREVVGP